MRKATPARPTSVDRPGRPVPADRAIEITHVDTPYRNAAGDLRVWITAYMLCTDGRRQRNAQSRYDVAADPAAGEWTYTNGDPTRPNADRARESLLLLHLGHVTRPDGVEWRWVGARVTEHIVDLACRGWVTLTDAGATLTEAGEAELLATRAGLATRPYRVRAVSVDELQLVDEAGAVAARVTAAADGWRAVLLDGHGVTVDDLGTLAADPAQACSTAAARARARARYLAGRTSAVIVLATSPALEADVVDQADDDALARYVDTGARYEFAGMAAAPPRPPLPLHPVAGGAVDELPDDVAARIDAAAAAAAAATAPVRRNERDAGLLGAYAADRRVSGTSPYFRVGGGRAVWVVSNPSGRGTVWAAGTDGTDGTREIVDAVFERCEAALRALLGDPVDDAADQAAGIVRDVDGCAIVAGDVVEHVAGDGTRWTVDALRAGDASIAVSRRSTDPSPHELYSAFRGSRARVVQRAASPVLDDTADAGEILGQALAARVDGAEDAFAAGEDRHGRPWWVKRVGSVVTFSAGGGVPIGGEVGPRPERAFGALVDVLRMASSPDDQAAAEDDPRHVVKTAARAAWSACAQDPAELDAIAAQASPASFFATMFTGPAPAGPRLDADADARAVLDAAVVAGGKFPTSAVRPDLVGMLIAKGLIEAGSAAGDVLAVTAAGIDVVEPHVRRYAARAAMADRDVERAVYFTRPGDEAVDGLPVGPTYPAPGSSIPGLPGYVVGVCGHRVARSEWAAGCRTCERCSAGSLVRGD